MAVRVREYRPGVARGVDERAVVEALREEARDFRAVVDGEVLRHDRMGERFALYAGWFGFE